MDNLFTLPIIPIFAFIGIASVFVYQLKLFLKQKKTEQIPKIPALDTQKNINNQKDSEKKLNLIKTKPKLKKNILPGNVKAVLSVGIGLFIVLNIVAITYFTRNSKTTYLPRAATEPTTVSFDFLTPTISPTLGTTITPTVNPDLTISPTLSPSFLAQANLTPTILLNTTITPTLVPTKRLEPTTTSTLVPTKVPTLASTPAVPPVGSPDSKVTTTISPTDTLLSKNSLTVIPTNLPSSIDRKITDKTATKTETTNKGGLTDIPEAGLTGFSVLLLVSSLILLGIGLVI